MKQTSWIIFVSLFVLFGCPLTVSASQIYSEGYFQYRVEEEGVVICGYFGKEAEVTVPPMIAGNPVSVIGQGAFGGQAYVKKVMLPDTVMRIEEGAFDGVISVIYEADMPSAPSEGPGQMGSDNSKIEESESSLTEDSREGNAPKPEGSGQTAPGTSGIGEAKDPKEEEPRRMEWAKAAEARKQSGWFRNVIVVVVIAGILAAGILGFRRIMISKINNMEEK